MNNYSPILIPGLITAFSGTIAFFLNKKKIIEKFSTLDEASQKVIPEENTQQQNNNNMLDDYWNNINSKKDSKQFEQQLVSESNQDSSQLKSSEFLPQELNQNWFDKDFNKVKEIDQDTLIDVSQYSSGMDTVGQTLKNPSYDIRGNIPNPKNIISPFLNSSIEPDNNIKSWC